MAWWHKHGNSPDEALELLAQLFAERAEAMSAATAALLAAVTALQTTATAVEGYVPTLAQDGTADDADIQTAITQLTAINAQLGALLPTGAPAPAPAPAPAGGETPLTPPAS